MEKDHRVRRITSSRSGLSDDYYDYIPSKTLRAGERQKIHNKVVVVDDWPDFVPITDQELRVMEAHFQDILDMLFGPIP